MDNKACECCECGHRFSSFSPRAYCKLCGHEYRTYEGNPVILDADEVTRIVNGTETKQGKLIRLLKEKIDMWAMDLEYEFQAGNNLYGAGMDRCASELKSLIEWYLSDNWSDV